MALVLKENITSILPHRNPMVMIDNLILANLSEFNSDFTIHTDNLFLDDNMFSEAGLIENIAQTAAAGFIYLNLDKINKVPNVFLAQIKNLKIDKFPLIGQQIETKTTILKSVLNITLIRGEIMLEGSSIAECEMKIVLEI